MWTVIYIAPNAEQAERVRAKLAAEGFLVKVRPAESMGEQYEILVPESEIAEVESVFSSLFHL